MQQQNEAYYRAMYPELYEPDERRRRAATERQSGPSRAPQTRLEQLDIGPPPDDEYVPFPIASLPIVVADYALQVAAAKEVEPEMAIIPELVALGAAIGNSRRIALKADWTESAMLWGAVVARPGSVKTSVIEDMVEPLQDYEDDLIDASEQAYQRYKSELSSWEHTPSKERGERPIEPMTRRQVVNETTTEELAYILRDNPRGLLLVQDEMAAWAGGMNQYKSGRGNDRSRWLSFWSGQRFSVDRRTEHGHPIRVRRPFVAVVGGLQPDMVRSLRPEDGADDGFIDRILFSWPAQRVRQWTDAEIDPYTRLQYRQLFDCLFSLLLRADPVNGRLDPLYVRLQPEAREAWVELYNQHHREMASADFDPRLHGACAKLDGYAARLALIIHLTREAGDEVEPGSAVDVQSALAAWTIADYFKAGARRVYGQMELTADDRKVAIAIEWMRKHGVDTVSARDCTTYRIAGVKTAPAVKALFHALADHGYGLASEETPSSGGRTRLLFRLNATEWKDTETRELVRQN